MKCGKCGKKITDPQSIQRGYGPTCWASISGDRCKIDSKAIFEEQVDGQMNFEDFPSIWPEDPAAGKITENHKN